MVSKAELILGVITLWFLVLSHFLEIVWVPLSNLLNFREKCLDLRGKSVCAVEMTMYVHKTCINVNRKDFNDFN